jgi:hypothetical protein
MGTFNHFPSIRQKPEDDAKALAQRGYYKEVNIWCDAAVEEARALQKNVPELNDIKNALDYLVGLQWKDAMPSYRAKPVSNEFLQMFWETVGLLTDSRPVFSIKDIGANGHYSDTEDVLNRLAKGWAATQKFERTLAFCIMYGMLTSAPCKVYWNPEAKGHSGDVDDYDITMEALSPSSVIALGDNAHDYQDAELVIYKRVRTLDWVQRNYPTMGKYVRAEALQSKFTVDVQSPLGVEPQLYPPLSPGMKRQLGIGDSDLIDSVYPKVEVQEFWKNNDAINESSNIVTVGPKDMGWSYQVKPGKRLYPRGQVIVRANNVILSDDPNPYFHRKKPFAKLGLYGVPWQEYALSIVAPWMKQQDILNQMMAGILQTVKKAVNPALMAPKSAINPVSMRAIDSSKPGLKISYSQNSPTPPAWQQPPNLPTYVFQSYGMILNSMKQSSGAQAVGDAMSKKQVPGSDSLEKISFAKNTPIRYMGRSTEWFLDDVGALWCGCALQFYDAPHRLALLGPAGLVKADLDNNPGSLIPDGINSESFVRRWHFMTARGSMLMGQKQERTQMAFAMRKGRDLSRRQLLKIIDWNLNEEENDKELADEAKAVAEAQAAAGVKPGGKK